MDSFEFDVAEPSNTDSNCRNEGNNRYKDSGIRQWLNSNKPAGQWWMSRHQFDAAPSNMTLKAGFLTRLDPNFLAVIGKTKIRVAIWYGGYDVLEDYFYLPSKTEIGLGNENNIQGKYDSKKLFP